MVPAAVAIIKESKTPIGIRKTALEMTNLVEIFNLDKNKILTSLRERYYYNIIKFLM
jgi:nitrogenase molybdenum-iron protein alpha/beta subunit